MNRFSRIAIVALAATLLSTTAFAGGFNGVGGTGIGELPQPKPTPIYIPIDIGGSKPGNNNDGSNGGNSGNGTIFIPGMLPDPNDDPVIIPSDPIIPGAGGSTGGGKPLTAQQVRALQIICTVAGTPLAMPNDLWLTNPGKQALPAGLKLRFTIDGTGQTGIFFLPEPIAAGAQLKIADILVGTPAGAGCTVKAIA